MSIASHPHSPEGLAELALIYLSDPALSSVSEGIPILEEALSKSPASIQHLWTTTILQNISKAFPQLDSYSKSIILCFIHQGIDQGLKFHAELSQIILNGIPSIQAIDILATFPFLPIPRDQVLPLLKEALSQANDDDTQLQCRKAIIQYSDFLEESMKIPDLRLLQLYLTNFPNELSSFESDFDLTRIDTQLSQEEAKQLCIALARHGRPIPPSVLLGIAEESDDSFLLILIEIFTNSDWEVDEKVLEKFMGVVEAGSYHTKELGFEAFVELLSNSHPIDIDEGFIKLMMEIVSTLDRDSNLVNRFLFGLFDYFIRRNDVKGFLDILEMVNDEGYSLDYSTKALASSFIEEYR